MSVSVESCVQAFIQACLESCNLGARKVFRQPSHFMAKEMESGCKWLAQVMPREKQTLARGCREERGVPGYLVGISCEQSIIYRQWARAVRRLLVSWSAFLFMKRCHIFLIRQNIIPFYRWWNWGGQIKLPIQLIRPDQQIFGVFTWFKEIC